MEDASADKIDKMNNLNLIKDDKMNEKLNPRHSTQVDASVKTRHSTRIGEGM